MSSLEPSLKGEQIIEICQLYVKKNKKGENLA